MAASRPRPPKCSVRFDDHTLAAAETWVRRGSIIKTNDPFEGG